MFGAWSLDQWNPMYIAPVFTALEYMSFRSLGVGVRQARIVPGICGIAAVWLLALGVATHRRTTGGFDRSGAPRHELLLRDVGPDGADGRPDGRVHGGVVVLLHALR